MLEPHEVPPGYPHDLESTEILRDGRRVWIRPIAPCDQAGLAWEIDHADGDTLHLRFFTRAVRSRPDFVESLVTLDYQEQLALAAIGDEGEGAGVARYACTDDPEVAQVAVVVSPEWRQVGLATILLERIQRAACERGIKHMTAVYLAANRGVDALRKMQGIPDPVVRHDLAEINWDLTEAGPTSPTGSC